MKQFFSYSLLVTTFILSVAAIGANVWDEDLVTQNNSSIVIDNVPNSTENSFFITVDEPFAYTNAIRVSKQRTSASYNIKVENAFYYLRTLRFSQLTHQQLNTTKSRYVSLYAGKEKNGYYIYALRKLRI